jgi:exosortase
MGAPSITATFRELPDNLRFALILAAGFMLFIVWDQWHWWQTREDYSFGFLVPMFVAYIIYDRWPRIVELVTGRKVNPAEGEESEVPVVAASLPGPLEVALKAAAIAALCGGLLLFFFGAFYRAGAGPSNPGSLFIALGFGVMMLPLIFLYTPPGSVGGAGAPSGWYQALRQDRRLQVAGLFLFVAFIWIISAPLVSVIETKLNLFLLGKVTYVVFFVFDMGGFPLEQQGNVLNLPNGTQVGVAEACSGIRSLTACLFAGSFLGAAFLNRWWKKVALIAAAMCLAVFTNLLRSLFLTTWAYNFGADAIEGFVHDAAGYAVLGLTCVGLICLLPLFNLSFTWSADDDVDWNNERPVEEDEKSRVNVS